MSYVEDIKNEEGFKGVVYKCTEGFDTIGYGTKLPLTKEEATLLLEYRLGKLKAELRRMKEDLEAKPVTESGTSNVDLLRRISQLEKVVFGDKE